MNLKEHLESSVPRKRKGDGISLRYDCPFCRGRNKLEYHPVDRVWHCHKCNRGGRFGGGKGRTPDEQGDFVDLDLSEYTPITETGGMYQKYLQEVRTLSSWKIKDLRPHRGPSLTRVYFPFYRLGESQPCYFTGRAVYPGLIPWMDPPASCGLRKSDLLWGLHRLDKRKTLWKILLCEGIFDAVHSRDRLSLSGKRVSSHQVETLLRLGPKEIYVILDGEAVEESYEIGAQLKNFPGSVWHVPLPNRKDPDEVREIHPWLRRKERLG